MSIEQPSPRGIVTYHTYAATCGVARFNRSLATAFNVPMMTLDRWLELEDKSSYVLSIKPTELDLGAGIRLLDALSDRTTRSFAVILHEFHGRELDKALAGHSTKCLAVDNLIAERARKHNSGIETGFAPGVIPSIGFPQVDVRLFSMGMAHKINIEGYRRLAQIVQSDNRNFGLKLAAAVHEGFDVGEAFESVPHEFSSCWDGDFFFLGFISDEMLSFQLSESDVAVLFGQYGARQSSSSILTAMEHEVPVISILDSDSSSWMKHGETIFDVNQLTRFPSQNELNYVASNAKSYVRNLTFSDLINRLK